MAGYMRKFFFHLSVTMLLLFLVLMFISWIFGIWNSKESLTDR